MLNHIHVCQLGVSTFVQLATGLCRQAQTRDDNKAGAWTWVPRVPKHPIPITYIHTHYMAWHGPPSIAILCAFIDCTYPSSSSSHLGAEDGDGKLSSHVKRERDIKGHISYQRNVKSNEYSSSRMAIFSCGTTNAHGWYVNGSNSRYVAISSVGFRHPGALAEQSLLMLARMCCVFEFCKKKKRYAVGVEESK
jgi:hypothetical protein